MKHNISYLFLRGLSRNQFHWHGKDIYEAVLQNEVHFLDLPGFGIKQNEVSPKTIEEIRKKLQEDWQNQSQKMNLSPIKIIVGMSLGGLVAMDWASESKEWNGLVMINSSVSDLSRPWERFNPKAYLPFLKGTVLNKARGWEEVIYDLTCNYSKDKMSIIEDWIKIRESYPPSYKNILNQLRAASKYKSPNTIDTPGLILTSTRDNLVSYKCSKAIADKFNFKIEISRSSGHDLSVDAKVWMLNHIKSFSENLLIINENNNLNIMK